MYLYNDYHMLVCRTCMFKNGALAGISTIVVCHLCKPPKIN